MDAVVGSLLGTLIGGAITFASTSLAQWRQAAEQRRQREAERRRAQRARIEEVYVFMLARATDSESTHLSAKDTNTLGQMQPAFELLATAEIRAAFKRCRELWFDYRYGSEHDEGPEEGLRAADHLASLMREHLASLDRDPGEPPTVASSDPLLQPTPARRNLPPARDE